MAMLISDNFLILHFFLLISLRFFVSFFDFYYSPVCWREINNKKKKEF